MAGCVDNTDSIALTTTGGALTADAIIDPGAGLPPNSLETNPAGLYVQGANGWLPLPAVLAYSSAPGNATYIATTSVNLTSFIGPGDKIWLTQSSTSLYFIVTAINSTTITLYGGTDYTLANSAITLPYFSKSKSPVGFPQAIEKWTVSVVDTSDRTQASPINGTWYNLGAGALTIGLPIGSWLLGAKATIYCVAPSTLARVNSTLSTSSTTIGNGAFGAVFESSITGASAVTISGTYTVEKPVTVAVLTTYYLNIMADVTGITTIAVLGADGPTTQIFAISAYL